MSSSTSSLIKKLIPNYHNADLGLSNHNLEMDFQATSDNLRCPPQK